MIYKEYIDQNGGRFLDELFELLSIPSISAESEHRQDMIRTAEWLKNALLKAGADRAEVKTTQGNPVVFAQKTVDPAKPTVVVYGHYDVMPVEPLDEWRTEPFKPVVKDGKIWGRGADDDKGQSFMHVKAFEMLVRTGTLPCNVKFMLEGEEEIGSPSLYKWCADNRELMKGDVILISDTGMIGPDTPSITCGLRGLCYMQVEVTGPDKDLHSGIFGGAVANPANVLCDIIASLVDNEGRVTIPHFYDKVRALTEHERTDFNRAPFSAQEYMRSVGVEALQGEEGYTTMERTGVRPTLDINGMWSGYTGEGTKTIIPSKATAKISMRLVPHQSYDEIADLFETHIKAIAPGSVKVKVENLHGGEPYVSPTDMKAYQAAQKAMETVYGKKPLPYYSGGSIPIVSEFERTLGMKSILMGFGLGEDSIHSPNESYRLENFYRGIETIALFYKFFNQ